MKGAMICCMAVLLFGCSPFDYDKVVTEQINAKFEVVRVKQPMYFSIFLKSSDGLMIKEKIDSKYCSDWKNVQTGTIYEIEITKISKYRDGKVVSEEYDLPSACTFAKYAKAIEYPSVR